MSSSSISSEISETRRVHRLACDSVREQNYRQAVAIYDSLASKDLPADWNRLFENNRAVLSALMGENTAAVKTLKDLTLQYPDFSAARGNLEMLDPSASVDREVEKRDTWDPGKGQRVVLISFFWNWPSPAGGIVHTLELATFLSRAGYEVKLLHPQYKPWRIGECENCPIPVETLPFTDREWNRAEIKRRFREAVDDIRPESVIVTDCWNFKPHLVEALKGYRVFLRMQAHECLCPLNNLRIKPHGGAGLKQCPNHQLAGRRDCLSCLAEHGDLSGALHQADRRLSEVDSPNYEKLLRRSLHEAEAVLVLNPLIAESLRPYCRRVETVTWGMDPARFPEPSPRPHQKPSRILFAGLAEEPIKGFETLKAAGRLLWKQRQDWELVVTGSPTAKHSEPFMRFVDWQSQAELPRFYREADIVAVPTLVQDGLSRTAVEGMASGRAVVGSRLGAMPFLISEGVSGLLCRAGDAEDWAGTLSRLLDDAALREELGRNGRRVFLERFQWDQVVEQQYMPLLVPQTV